MKSNKTFMLLSFFGILMMVDGHAGSYIGFFDKLFPYDSFFMPMFVFISGYFFESRYFGFQGLRTFVKKKIGHLLYPYFLINFLMLLITIGFNNAVHTNWKIPYSVQEFLMIAFTYGTPVDLASPLWFVMMLFEVSVLYAIIYFAYMHFLKRTPNAVDNIFLGILIFSIAAFAVSFCEMRDIHSAGQVLSAKLLFFLFFFYLGDQFKRIEEKFYNQIGLIVIFPLIVCFQLYLLYCFGIAELKFESLAFMSSFKSNNILLPFITSINGILFWWSISNILSVPLARFRLINFISEKTLYILSFHLFFFNVLNLGLLKISGGGE